MSDPTATAAHARLAALSVAERIATIARDVSTRTDAFAAVDSHALAELLGIDDADKPGGDWTFTGYAELLPLERQAKEKHPASEFVYALQGKVPAARFSELKSIFETMNERRPDFSALTPAERATIEEVLAREDLEGHLSNGIHSIARINVGNEENALWFEGDIEDDGTCLTLRTPYDQRDGKFVDLTHCVTTSW